MEKYKTVLCLVAHPDDAEFQCAGTLALLAEKGWKIVIATMTPGQAGSAELSSEEISSVRRKEAANAAGLIKGDYYCLESEDIFIQYDRPTLLKVIRLFREISPSIVFTASPSDYIVDHEVTSKIAQTACLASTIPNIKTDNLIPPKAIPHLYYCDPMQGKNIYGQDVESEIYVNIGTTIGIKEKMLSCHKSQRDWLFRISKVDEYIIMMKEFTRKKGKIINCEHAEGFRQHLGFSYPSNNILKTELNNLVIL